MPKYKLVDMESYPRKEHFYYYQNIIPCGYSMTVRLDLSKFIETIKGYKFYPSMIYVISKTVNSMDNMKSMLTEDKQLGIWETIHPVFTIFHKDDETFSDLWMEYNPNFKEFYFDYLNVLSNYGNNKGIKGRKDQPSNIFCISCVPWIDFDGYSTYSPRGAALFPIITYGKLREDQTISFTLSISHACCDGYHVHKFFDTLQNNLNDFTI